MVAGEEAARLMRKYGAILVFATGALSAGAAFGQADAEKAVKRTWSVAPYVGLHQPSLEALVKGAFKAPYEGTAQLLNPVGNNQQGTFSYPTPLPEFASGTITGLEFSWRMNDRHSLLFGASTWQATSTASSRGLFPVQGDFESITAQRKASLSYNEYYFGWRYNFERALDRKYRFYFSATLHQYYDIDYREDFTAIFLSGPPRTFRKSIVIQAQATGLPLLQGMGGAEWFVTDWLSLGLEGGLGLGLRKVELQPLGTIPIRSDFLATDNVQVQPPVRQNLQERNMEYKSEAGGDYQTMKLNFNGWKALFKVTLYY